MAQDFDDYENDREADLPEENPREKGDDDGVEYGDPRDRDDDVEYYDERDYDDDDDRSMFADPGSGSALRAASRTNPRNLPCPTCDAPNRLTPADRARGYQCDACADRAERGCD